ncbi:hypothetical protein FACS189455_2610 [Bacteroidia bacterium]|nr:hypothetical protein FACS189455_2610 [Bacteroidia bacterium]
MVAEAAYLVDNADYTADASGKIALSESWLGQNLSIIKKGNGTTTVNSDAQTLAVPARPAAPTVQGVNETITGLNNGQITGVSPAMEYKLSTALNWTAITGTTVTNLAPGSYQVRIKATISAFASTTEIVIIATGTAQTRVLTVTAPIFTAADYGYARPEAQAITIANSGNSATTITMVSVSGSDFEIANGDATVSAGGNITTWTIQPKAGLSADTHTATITVTYNGTAGTTATADVTFTVNALVNAAMPVITGQPQDETADEGDNVTLSVTASVSDNGDLSYQWYSSNTTNSNSTAINGETSASYSPPTNATGTHYYYVVVTNTNNGVNGTKTASEISRTATVTVNAIAIVNAATPVITGQPQSATVNLGGNVSMSVTASVSDGGDLSYQWYAYTANSNGNGTAIGGANGSVYSPPTNAIGTHYYYVVVTNTNNNVNGAKTATATSNPAAVTVNAPVYTITIGGTTNGTVTANPTSATAGTTVTLTVTPATGYESDAISTMPTVETRLITSLQNGTAIYEFTMPASNITVNATFKKTQAQLDREAVEAAKVAIEGGTFRIAQATGNDAANVKTWLAGTLNVLFGQSHGVQFRSSSTYSMLGDVTVKAITPAVTGTESNPEGTNGSFTFTVNLERGATKLTAAVSTGVIVAIPHVSTPVKRIELLLLNDLMAHILNTGNVETGDLTLTLSGANADVFTISGVETDNYPSLPVGGETNIAITPRTNLAVGTYRVTLTVSGEGITSVSVEITHTVKPTGIDSPQAKALKAYVQNGLLHVSGLTAGKPWSIYSISGALIYQSVAHEDKADINLSIRGMYIVTSGNAAVKVVY